MTISALKDTLAHPEYLKHNINTQDQVSLILPGRICTCTHASFIASQGGYSYPSRRDIPGYNQARRDTTTGGGPGAFHPRDLYGPGENSMLPNYNQSHSRTDLCGGPGPGAQNREVRFPPPGTIFHGRTQDPRLANRGTKRENDESQDGMFFH